MTASSIAHVCGDLDSVAGAAILEGWVVTGVCFIQQGVDPTNGCVWGTPAAGMSQQAAYMPGWGFSPQPMLPGNFILQTSTSDLHKCPSLVSLQPLLSLLDLFLNSILLLPKEGRSNLRPVSTACKRPQQMLHISPNILKVNSSADLFGY